MCALASRRNEKKKKKINTYGQSRDRLLGPYLDHNKSLIWITSRPQIAVLDDSKSQIWTCARPQIADVDMRTSANRGCGRQQIAYLDDSKSQIWTTANRRCGHAHVRKSRMWTCARPQIADLDDSKSVIWITARPQNRYVDVMTIRNYGSSSYIGPGSCMKSFFKTQPAYNSRTKKRIFFVVAIEPEGKDGHFNVLLQSPNCSP